MKLCLLGLGLIFAFFSAPVRALEYPWTYLTAENDSRDPEVQDQDEAQSQNMIQVMNDQEPFFNHRLFWRKSAIENLLTQDAPFCEMHFDAVKPFSFTPAEKSILAEYLKRGGFILFFIDAYPYPQDEFWKIKQWPLIDFLTTELPASDPDFAVGRATDAFPIFKVRYHTETADAIRHELTGNPNTPNRTLLFYQKRLCCLSWASTAIWRMTPGFPSPVPSPAPSACN